ncbi:MAG: cytochrome c biogenesis protein CcsA, partial [Akkermansiaceae bacterium]|nr:cytochrome c biogenesis protein CcsA [Akkermansiaceae bacterium]
VAVVDPWREAHAAFSVLSYGAFALAAVAGLMFLVLNRQLKDHNLGTGLFRNMPPVPALLESVVRLTWLGVIILAVGLACGFLMKESASGPKLLAGVITWALYFVIMVVHAWRGMTPRRFSMGIMGVFVSSLLVFAFV